jgi:phosphoribosylformylglycinamidine synthase
VRGLIDEKLVTAVHDISDGGLLVAVAEMALAGNIGARLYGAPAFLTEHGFWFGEDQARYVVTDQVRAGRRAGGARQDGRRADPPHRMTHGNALTLPGERQILLDAARAP